MLSKHKYQCIIPNICNWITCSLASWLRCNWSSSNTRWDLSQVIRCASTNCAIRNTFWMVKSVNFALSFQNYKTKTLWSPTMKKRWIFEACYVWWWKNEDINNCKIQLTCEAKQTLMKNAQTIYRQSIRMNRSQRNVFTCDFSLKITKMKIDTSRHNRIIVCEEAKAYLQQ